MPFYVQNVSTGLVLDIKGSEEDAHGTIIMHPYHGGKNQLWKHKNGMIVSKLNKLALDINQSDNNRIITFAPHGGDNQIWHFDGDNTIRSNTGLVLDVKGGDTNLDAEVIAHPKHGGPNQQFKRVEV